MNSPRLSIFLAALAYAEAPLLAAASTETGASALELLTVAQRNGHHGKAASDLLASLVTVGALKRHGERYFSVSC